MKHAHIDMKFLDSN